MMAQKHSGQVGGNYLQSFSVQWARRWTTDKNKRIDF